MKYEILERAFKAMPNVFTSNQFTSKAYELGHRKLPTGGGFATYLHRYAKIETTGGKTWIKNSQNINQDFYLKDNKKVLEDVFKAMPDVFTAREFRSQLEARGYNPYRGKKGFNDFLSKHAKTEYPKSKTWIKKTGTSWIEPISEKTDLQKAIELLKNNGFRILKPINQWEEL